jgi:Tfp pilus assembly pilus retraction ATPase PilT
MWDVKTEVITLTVRPRTKPKSFRKYLSNILGKHKIKKVQETSILDNAHILQNILMLKYNTFNRGNNISCIK